jgi:hypothetical protein
MYMYPTLEYTFQLLRSLRAAKSLNFGLKEEQQNF